MQIKQTSTDVTNPLAKKYLYKRKEFHPELGLDWYSFEARFYDPTLGRFPNVDPIIEKFPYLTPYNYASNNPVTNIDLWGLQRTSVNSVWEGFMQLGPTIMQGFEEIGISFQKKHEEVKSDKAASGGTDKSVKYGGGEIMIKYKTEGTSMDGSNVNGTPRKIIKME